MDVWKIVAVVCAIVLVMAICTQPQGANDFWLQAKVGELIVKEHTIPSTLLFPFTNIQGRQFNAHEWLPSILFFTLISAVGVKGLAWVMGGAGLLLFVTVVRMVHLRSAGNLAFAMLLGLLAVAVESYRHTLRPELVSLFLMVGFLHYIENFRTNSNNSELVKALFIVVLWTNAHGSFVLAPIIAGLYAAGMLIEKYRNSGNSVNTSPMPYLVFSIMVLVCTLVNPSGFEQLKFAVTFSNTTIPMYEWLPSFDSRVMQLRGFWIALSCYIVTIVTMAFNWRKLNAVDVLLFLFFSVLAFKAMRFMVYIGIISAYVLAKIAPISWQNIERQKTIYLITIALSVIVVSITLTHGNAQGSSPFKITAGEKFSDDLVATLKNPSLHGNVINSAELGAELVYIAYPRLRPSIDSRIDSYGADYFALHNTIFQNDIFFKQLVEKYDVRYLLLNKDDFANIIKTLGPSIDVNWSIRSIDKRAVLIERRI